MHVAPSLTESTTATAANGPTSEVESLSTWRVRAVRLLQNCMDPVIGKE